MGVLGAKQPETLLMNSPQFGHGLESLRMRSAVSKSSLMHSCATSCACPFAAKHLEQLYHSHIPHFQAVLRNPLQPARMQRRMNFLRSSSFFSSTTSLGSITRKRTSVNSCFLIRIISK